MARRRFNPKPKKILPGDAAAAAARAAAAAAGVASINLEAMTGRSDIHVGGRVIIGSGLGAGEIATVESVAGGVIPAAFVRTDSGLARRVRTIDLTPVVDQPAKSKPDAAPAGDATPGAEAAPGADAAATADANPTADGSQAGGQPSS